MNYDEKGYEFAKGALRYVARCFLVGLGLIVVANLLYKATGYGTDDSDRSGWERSGLRIHTDAKTGVEYLSDGKGGLTPRIYPREPSQESR